MPISDKQRSLIDQLENLSCLGQRYSNLVCINKTESIDVGSLSLVFKAKDAISGASVAIKFFNPDKFDDLYRLGSFRREPDILLKILGYKRCLQLVEGLCKFDWKVDTTSGPMYFPVEYFVTEWIENDVNHYLNNQKNIETIFKLSFFKNLVLAVEAIQRLDLVHRDLKSDNIRSMTISGDEIVTIIDFGTSARKDTEHLKNPGDYEKPVGAKAISAPEAFAGFASDRESGYLADHFALGTILFDLFNESAFRHAQSQDTQYKDVLDQMVLRQCNSQTRAERLNTWSANFNNFKNIKTSPDIRASGNSVPSSLRIIIEDVYKCLIHFNFLERETNLARIRRKIDIALVILNNEYRTQRELDKRRRFRLARKAKAEANEKRLNVYLSNKSMMLC